MKFTPEDLKFQALSPKEKKKYLEAKAQATEEYYKDNPDMIPNRLKRDRAKEKH